jgi:hypothetical protein
VSRAEIQDAEEQDSGFREKLAVLEQKAEGRRQKAEGGRQMLFILTPDS